MNLCDDKHQEVCFEGRECPVCNMRTEKDQEIDGLEKQLVSLKIDLDFANSELAKLDNP